MLASYQKHWLSYQQGAKFLHNLFSYFNRVSLKKYKMNEPDNSLEAILGGQTSTLPPGCPLEIRNVSPPPNNLITVALFIVILLSNYMLLYQSYILCVECSWVELMLRLKVYHNASGCCLVLQWNLRTRDTLGLIVLSLIERLSLSRM